MLSSEVLWSGEFTKSPGTSFEKDQRSKKEAGRGGLLLGAMRLGGANYQHNHTYD